MVFIGSRALMNANIVPFLHRPLSTDGCRLDFGIPAALSHMYPGFFSPICMWNVLHGCRLPGDDSLPIKCVSLSKRPARWCSYFVDVDRLLVTVPCLFLCNVTNVIRVVLILAQCRMYLILLPMRRQTLICVNNSQLGYDK